jgi:glycosyltransferase involved in cell wall biosynthesis
MLDITIALCTRNRADWVRRDLAGLLAQSVGSIRYEVLVVDNASEDETFEVVKEFLTSDSGRVRYVHEGQVGLSAAKNRAVMEARSPLIAFIDDDAVPIDDWIKQACEPFLDSQMMVATGPVYGLWESSPPPDWLVPELWCLLGLANYGSASRWLDRRESVMGGNSVYRLDVFKRVGLFSTSLGRKGESGLLSSEEVEFQIRCRRAGFRTWYNPRMIIYHWVPTVRASKDYLIRRRYWEGRSMMIVDALSRGRWRMFAIALARLALGCTRDGLGLLANAVKRSEHGQLLYQTRLAKHLGYIGQALVDSIQFGH